MQLKPFFEPRSVAIIGIRIHVPELEFNILKNLLEYGYQGAIYPVHPTASEILGIKAYPSVKDTPGDVDLAVISTPRSIVPKIVKECTEKGIKLIIIVSQGFADAEDEEGKELQEEVIRIARKGGARIVGPNTLGTVNAFINFSTSFARQLDMQRIPVGVICQTGMFLANSPQLKLLGKGIDLGNACDVNCAECLEYFGQDPEVRLIVMHIEGMREGRKFLEVCGQVAKKKPILALKTGTSEKAAKAALSHTGSLVGRDDVWDAAFRHCGVVRVSDHDELGDMAKTFLHLPLVKGRRLGVISMSGGIGIMSLDACEKYDLEMAKLSSEAERKLIEMSPPWMGIGNPVDLWPAIMTSRRPVTEVLRTGLHIVLSDQNVDAVLLIAAAYFERLSTPVTQIVFEAADTFRDKPIVWWPYEGWMYQICLSELEKKVGGAGVAIFPSPDRAIRALAKLADYTEFRLRSEVGSSTSH
jgi:acetyltransferase